MVVVMALSLHFGGDKADETKDYPERKDQADIGAALLCNVSSDLRARHDFSGTQKDAKRCAK
jgi:hypothetical protein